MDGSTNWSRRDVLKRGSIAAGALVVGTGALSGGALAQGGSGFISDRGRSNIGMNTPFWFEHKVSQTLDLQPSCKGNPAPKTYQAYQIRNANGDIAWFYLNPNADVIMDPDFKSQFQTVTTDCSEEVTLSGQEFDMRRVSYRSV